MSGRAIVLRPNPDDLRNAARYFEDAIALDPGYADAWAGLASAYKRMPMTGAADANDAFPKARDAANRALVLHLGRRDEALATFDRVIQLRRHPSAIALRGYTLARMNRRADAEAALSALDAQAHHQRAVVLHALGRDDEAMTALRAAIDTRKPHVTFIGIDRKWDDLCPWEPFRALAKRVNLFEVSDRTADRFAAR